MKNHAYPILGSLVVSGLVLLHGSILQAGQEQLAASVKEVLAESNRTHDQLGSTLSALNALSSQSKGDLRPAYEAFAKEVPKTQEAAELTRNRVSHMQSDGQTYFEGWQKEIDGIANESLRKKAQKRLNSVKKSYAKAFKAFSTGADKFTPFLSDLGDIQKTLVHDITPGGVSSIRSTVSSANYNYNFVNRSINDGMKELKKMEKSLSTEM